MGVNGRSVAFEQLYRFRVLLQQKELAKAEDVLCAVENCEALTEAERVGLGIERALLECVRAECEGDDCYGRALTALERVRHHRAVSPETAAEASVCMAEVLLKLDRHDEAVRCARVVAELQGDSMRDFVDRARFVLARIALMRKQYDAVCRHADALKDARFSAYRDYGYYTHAHAARARDGMTDEVRDLYDCAVAHFGARMLEMPEDMTPCIYRARCYADLGQWDRAAGMVRLLPFASAEQVLAKLNEM